MSAVVQVRDVKRSFVEARVLLDTCATAHFITANFARKLGLPTRTCSIPIGAINEMRTVAENSIEIHFKSRYSNFTKQLTFLIVPKITDATPNETFPRELIDIPRNLRLADPQFHIPRPVDLLIGSGATLSMLSVGQINLSRNDCDLHLQKTQLGWVIVGGIDEGSKRSAATCHLSELVEQLAKFWLIEEVPVEVDKQGEDVCDAHYRKTTTRNPDGRYVVRLPFNRPEPDLGDSRTQALKRFRGLERSFKTSPDKRTEYSKVMQEYIDLGHMTLVFDETLVGYYLCHHAVFKLLSVTTKLRVVNDASAKTDKGISLNDVLLVGPNLQDKLFIHLLRFRMHVYVLTADIEKMYRQVLVHPDDRRYQRIFWYHEGVPRVFELNTVTFGVSSAPYLAIRTIHQLADDEKAQYPRAAEVLKRDLYVDDLLTGSDSLEDIRRVRDEVISVLKRGGFNIRQWASNHDPAIDDLDEKVLNLHLATEDDSVLKTLGVSWASRRDELVYSVKSIDTPSVVNKRTILSEIAKIFDPLGLLGPVILYAKSIMQECWKAKVDWDESVPQELHTLWIKFARQLNLLSDISIERHLLTKNPSRIEIHGFCDASQTGYGASLYVRSIDKGQVIVTRKENKVVTFSGL